MQKRILSLLMCIVILLSLMGNMLASPVSASVAPTIKNIIYMIPDGGAMAPFFLQTF